MIIKNPEQYFDFLITEFGFRRIPEYSYSREKHIDYVKRDIVIKIVFDGGFWVDFVKTKTIIPELENGTIRVVDLDLNKQQYFDLTALDPKNKIFNSVTSKSFLNNPLLYYSTLLHNNPEILNGDLKKLTFTYNILKYFRII